MFSRLENTPMLSSFGGSKVKMGTCSYKLWLIYEVDFLLQCDLFSLGKFANFGLEKKGGTPSSLTLQIQFGFRRECQGYSRAKAIVDTQFFPRL